MVKPRKKLISFRASDKTAKEIVELAARFGETQAEIISRAVDAFYRLRMKRSTPVADVDLEEAGS